MLANYIKMMHYIDTHKHKGNALEIGSFNGDGAVLLSTMFDKVYVIEPFIFNTNDVCDEYYERYLKVNEYPKNKWLDNCRNSSNIILYEMTSDKVKLGNTELSFSFIDGNHEPQWVENDLNLAWKNTIKGGVVACHDYQGDLTETTKAIDDWILKHKEEIDRVYIDETNITIYIHKR